MIKKNYKKARITDMSKGTDNSYRGYFECFNPRKLRMDIFYFIFNQDADVLYIFDEDTDLMGLYENILPKKIRHLRLTTENAIAKIIDYNLNYRHPNGGILC